MRDTTEKTRIIRVGSRESRLAVKQAEIIMDRIGEAFPDVRTELITMKTTGDKILDKTLDQIGGKGLFVRELDAALLSGACDITVHSLKDLPKDTDARIPLCAFSKREDPRDVLVLPEDVNEPDLSLPIGTSSLRRSLQIRKIYPGAETKPVRGNVETRLRKLDEGQYSGLVMAAAGLKRLGLEHRISRYFEADEMIPASCQGILGIQARADDEMISAQILKAINDKEAELTAYAERSFVRTIGADCGSPDTAYATVKDGMMRIRGLRYDAASGRVLTEMLEGKVNDITDAEALGSKLAKRLLSGGNKGKVWLVGAGPGDYGLMTLKGMEVLRRADVIIYDALIGGSILSAMPESAEKIYAGKRSGVHTLKQEEINRLLLEKSLEGLNVVRLKGGDPFVFGRGGEELELLAEHDIPYEIVPGVTSAFAVPAYAGIPVTHRDYCSSVHVITGHRRKDHTRDIDFKALAETGGTLVFLMGIASLSVITQGLLDAGMDADTPAAIVEKGTTASQRTIRSTLGGLTDEASEADIIMPAIIIVGKVAALEEDFAWRQALPLSGVRAIVTRPKELISGLAQMLREKGADTIELPAIEIKADEEHEDLRKAIGELSANGYEWLVFTSPSGVRVFMESLMKEHDIRILAHSKIAAIGRGTEREILKYGIRPDMIPSVYDGKTLGAELAPLLKSGDRVLIPRARIGNKELIEELSAAKDVTVTDLPTYDTVYTSQDWFDADAAFDDPHTYALFTSASTVRGFVQAYPGLDCSKVRAVCIGKQTAAEAEHHGMRVFTSEKATLASLVSRLEEVVHLQD